jgi:predicted AlkP superfamily phosphohydrolase/phosphomutase
VSSQRIVIVGLDGMSYRLIKDLAQDGTMPNAQALIDGGVFKQMTSSIAREIAPRRPGH